jgi:GT2 family glycosyltransferase
MWNRSELMTNSLHPRVIILLLHWKGDWTRACLQSLRELDYPNYQVVVVDNGCRDQSIDEVRALFPAVTVLRVLVNCGYSGGNNVGIRWAQEKGSDYVWLLNNDTQVFPETLSELVTLCEENPEVGAAGSVLYEMTAPSKVQAYGGGWVGPLGTSNHYLRRPKDGKIDYICGASLMLRSQALERVGLLDEGYFLYWEDVDLCYRIKAGGWQLGVAERSQLLHQGSGTTQLYSPRWDYDFTLSSIRFYRKFHPLPWLAVLWTVGRTVARRLIYKQFTNLPSLIRAVRDGMSAKG